MTHETNTHVLSTDDAIRIKAIGELLLDVLDDHEREVLANQLYGDGSQRET